MSVPTFIVGTGRCGSTMLSNMLREHPHVLSLSEFYGFVDEGSRTSECFSSELMDGRQFWAIVSAINPLSSFAYRQGVPCTEQLYRPDAPDARFSSRTGVPGILVTALPHLTDAPDALFDVLEDEVKDWPTAGIGDHYRHLFSSLANRFNKRLWVERTGTSIRLVDQFLMAFPDARFIHLVRDGRDAAISMQEHLLFRIGFVLGSLAAFLGVDPIESADRTLIERVPQELRPFLPEHFDADAFRAFRLPLPLIGQLWSQQIESGLSALSAVPADRLLNLRYEDFLVDPKQQLDTFAAFLGKEFVDESWSARCAATIRKPRSTWRDLPEKTARALTEACAPGFKQLRAAGVDYSGSHS